MWRFPFSIYEPFESGLNFLKSTCSHESLAIIELVKSVTNSTFFYLYYGPFEIMKCVSVFYSMSFLCFNVFKSFLFISYDFPYFTRRRAFLSSSTNYSFALSIKFSLRTTIFFFMALPRPILKVGPTCF